MISLTSLSVHGFVRDNVVAADCWQALVGQLQGRWRLVLEPLLLGQEVRRHLPPHHRGLARPRPHDLPLEHALDGRGVPRTGPLALPLQPVPALPPPHQLLPHPVLGPQHRAGQAGHRHHPGEEHVVYVVVRSEN